MRNYTLKHTIKQQNKIAWYFSSSLVLVITLEGGPCKSNVIIQSVILVFLHG